MKFQQIITAMLAILAKNSETLKLKFRLIADSASDAIIGATNLIKLVENHQLKMFRIRKIRIISQTGFL